MPNHKLETKLIRKLFSRSNSFALTQCHADLILSFCVCLLFHSSLRTYRSLTVIWSISLIGTAGEINGKWLQYKLASRKVREFRQNRWIVWSWSTATKKWKIKKCEPISCKGNEIDRMQCIAVSCVISDWTDINSSLLFHLRCHFGWIYATHTNSDRSVRLTWTRVRSSPQWTAPVPYLLRQIDAK